LRLGVSPFLCSFRIKLKALYGKKGLRESENAGSALGSSEKFWGNKTYIAKKFSKITEKKG
jgi:hypothetical protein